MIIKKNKKPINQQNNIPPHQPAQQNHQSQYHQPNAQAEGNYALSPEVQQLLYSQNMTYEQFVQQYGVTPEQAIQSMQAEQQTQAQQAPPQPATPPPSAQQQIEEEPAGPVIKDRQERRRGDRRRGYRRIDDRNLISRAHEESNAIRENATREGFEYGINLAKEELKKLNHVMVDFIRAKDEAMKAASPDIAFIALKVAEKLIKISVEKDQTTVLRIVGDVLKEFEKDETNIIIKTNPSDTQLVKDNLVKLFPYNQEGARILVIDDETVDWGSCIVETSNGMIDARFSTQLDLLRKAFEEGM